MSGQFDVVLSAFPAGKVEHMERVIHKHNRAYDHQKVHSLAAAVAAGQEQVVATYPEQHIADNVVNELRYHGATAAVREPASDEDAA